MSSCIEHWAKTFTLLALTASTPSSLIAKANEGWLFLVEQVSGERLIKYVEDLVAFKTRYALSGGANFSAKYLYRYFSTLRGFNVSFHLFPLPLEDRRVGLNVVACKPGVRESAGHILLFAHYDSVSNDPYASAPGADDNASGVAVMMEAAYVMSLYDWNRTLIFTAFSGEEIGFIGSSAWAKENEDLLKNVVGGVCLDGVGRGETVSIMYADEQSKALADLTLNVSIMLGFKDFREVASVLGVEGSDSHVFLERGLKVIRLWDEDTTYIHSPLDLPETLYPNRLVETCKVITATLHLLLTESFKDLYPGKTVKLKNEGARSLLLAAVLASSPTFLLIYTLLKWRKRFPSSQRWVKTTLTAYISGIDSPFIFDQPSNHKLSKDEILGSLRCRNEH